ncbi:hypothetical protein CTAYLR_006130 [Chrysophaeum taylorii]|uniref:Uncharacterized protein n=1 Tax=Chrysophaeum taylorii TaxID=2483200 RepID=A0AAD7XQB7_9STRA|nr:hypothetical protein CTAYLR_006130 [Chrysophaeum taylorii]
MERISEALPGEDAVDNLYLDMNGIIHQCTHSNDDQLVTTSMKEQFVRIFQFTDKVCKLVGPQKLIYLAVDGIAPRAKMNQQRARRFRSSLERTQLMEDILAAGGELPEVHFDSNCITPGTEFMFKLGIAFEAWLEHKTRTDPFYQGPLVIFSGCDVPGEGEHKIMDFIREEAAKPGWDSAQRHCFYGLDADLIMLSLVTHQPNFRLLREKMRRKKDPLTFGRYDFEILEVSLLREMIELELKTESGERAIDDFVFLCMLVGNDFLPHVPHLDILSGSLDLSLQLYRELLPNVGFLTDKEKIHLDRFEIVIRALATFERGSFERRASAERVPEYRGDGYRDHYYKTKFGIDPDREPDKIRAVARDYVLGLFWCVQYYHRGVKSWDWYYPYMYAPLASDLVDLADLDFEFPTTNSKPFTPLMQLLSVLPPQSSNLLPAAYADLMTGTLKESYPLTFDVDPNGKAQPWEAVVLIPFLDEDAMVDELSRIDHTSQLTELERKRNKQNNHVWRSRRVDNITHYLRTDDDDDVVLRRQQPPSRRRRRRRRPYQQPSKHHHHYDHKTAAAAAAAKTTPPPSAQDRPPR